MSSVVEITVAGADVSANVMYSTASFESQQNGQPGAFEMTLRDIDQTLGPFVTGSVVTCTIDGVLQYGGYLTQVSRKFALPVDELPADSRLWVLRGVDYNILFDKRVTRNPANYLAHLPVFNGSQYDGTLLKLFCANYLDLPAGFDAVSEVDDVALPFGLVTPVALRVGGWKQQGTIWREQIELLQQWSGAVFYISPDLKLHYHAIEDSYAPFGFSDAPNPPTTIGMRDVLATEAGGPQLINDALVWGGSEWTEGVIFGRAENAGSITAHNRWQEAEHHFGEDSYKLDTQWRADLIVEGSPAIVGFNPGKAFPQWTMSFSWFAERQPPGASLRAGQLVEIDLTTHGGDLSPITLPCRSLRITFPGVDPEGLGHVEFRADLGLSATDPFSLWALLRDGRKVRPQVVAAATNATLTSTYGAFGQFTPVLVSGLIYEIPNDIGYIANTTQVFDDGLLLQRGAGYSESDPVAGQITFASAPAGDIWLVCRTT